MNEELETTKEIAKATQEVAKTVSRGLDVSRDMGRFVSKFISGPIEEGMGIIEDKLKYIRWERRQRLMSRAEEFMRDKGFSDPDSPVPLKNAVRFLEFATLEDNDSLQDLWAMLLVNGTNSTTGIKIERSFIEILGQLSPLEAKILEAVYSLPYEETRHNGVITENLPISAKVTNERSDKDTLEPDDEVKIALSNLVRLGCLKFPMTWGGGEIFTSVNTTLIGKKLVAACTK
ncbi:Abi-alpha family protein [Aeromonas jandaei]|uniref:Abi-alpha family protein n=1 Tax=Aeromonas jandaei TaxID=650 RepID=UPI0039873A66